jgi:hypothetical protein
MNLGELQAAVNKAFTEGACKTDKVYLNLDINDYGQARFGEPYAVEQQIHDRKRRVVVIKGY